MRGIDFGDLTESAGLAEFEGASSGLLGQDDLEEAANALEPGTVAAVLMWENRWAAPVAVALRRSGGQLVASGRIPVQAIIASLDASESSPDSEEHHARTASRDRPHRRRRRHGDRRQQPRLAPPGAALGAAGLPAGPAYEPPPQAAPPPPAAAPAPDPIEQLQSSRRSRSRASSPTRSSPPRRPRSSTPEAARRLPPRGGAEAATPAIDVRATLRTLSAAADHRCRLRQATRS